MSGGITPKGSAGENADSPSSRRKIFLGGRGIRLGWRLVIFLLVFAAMSAMTTENVQNPQNSPHKKCPPAPRRSDSP